MPANGQLRLRDGRCQKLPPLLPRGVVASLHLHSEHHHIRACSGGPSSPCSLADRHTLDPYITAGLLTDACSSSTTTGANCFGRSKSDDLRVALVLVALGATAFSPSWW